MRMIVLSILVGCSARTTSLGLERVVPAASDGRTGLGALDRDLSLAVQHSYRTALAKVEPPLTLVPSDGSELALKALDAKVTLTGPVAHTELHLTFHNAEPRVREGRFAIALPPGATVGKLAMKVHGVWRESRVVSRARGREVYETFLHRRVDPALLERDLGNQFSARIFPIAPGEDKEIIVAYEHLVSASAPYRLALAGLPAVPACRVAIDRDGATTQLDVSGRAPSDVVLAVEPGHDAVAADQAFVARVEVPATGARASLDRTLFLVDTSASRAPVMAKQTELLRALLAGLPPQTTVAIATFDHQVRELVRGTAGRAHEVLPAILDHGALGASDLGAALARAATSGLRRVVVIGDGAPTLGETEPKQLAAIVERSPIERVDVIQVGDSLDRDTLGLVVAAGAVPGAILTSHDPGQLAHQLGTALAPPSSIRVAGATSWPETTAGIAPGEPIFVFGLRDESGPLAISVASHRFVVSPRSGAPTRVRRAVAGAELAELTAQLQIASNQARPQLAAQIEQLALAHGLVSPMTSLIVLETDADEQRMLGTREDPRPRSETQGDVVEIRGSAPMIDQGSTKTGITITDDYLRSIPTGRTFAGVLAAAAGEAVYLVDAVRGAIVTSRSRRLTTVPGDTGVSSPLTQAQVAEAIKTNAFALSEDAVSLEPPAPQPRPAYTGTFRDVMVALHAGKRDRALALATRWQLANPGEVAAILALGEALEARGADALAARAYGSLVDLYPNRVELVRVAGARFERLAKRTANAGKLAIDSYRRALRERPDHPTSYRLLAFALLRDDRADDALDLICEGKRYGNRQWGVQEALGRDALLIAAHLVARDPARRDALTKRLGRSPPTHASLHVVLTWESDASDLDLEVVDRNGNASSWRNRMASGGGMLANISDGYGPEVFAVDHASAFPYRARVRAVTRGPTGIAAGTVQIIRHDGAGNVTVEDRPFVIQQDGGTVELGTIAR